jgi:aminopeptidase N
MALTIHLSPTEESKLKVLANARGTTVEKIAEEAVKKVLPPDDVAEKIRKLQSILEIGDPEEQRETWEYLKKALDEDRLSYRKLFP